MTGIKKEVKHDAFRPASCQRRPHSDGPLMPHTHADTRLIISPHYCNSANFRSPGFHAALNWCGKNALRVTLSTSAMTLAGPGDAHLCDDLSPEANGNSRKTKKRNEQINK